MASPALAGARAPSLLAFGKGAGAAATLLLFALLAIVEPLAAYSVALAIFGLPHVLSELRYVDRRFGRRIASSVLACVFALLAAIVAVRILTLAQLLPPRIGVTAELSVVALLALACAGGTALRRTVAVLLGLAIGTAALAEPFAASVIFAILHNLTPLGLLWQLVPRPERKRVLGWATAALLGLPLLVATGLPRLVLDALGIAGAGADPVQAGPLTDHLRVYVPAWLVDGPHGVDLFTASVVAQGGHYLAVIVILPFLLRRIEPDAAGLVRWPRPFALLLAGAAAASFAFFLTGFFEARSYYGVAAALHAWIEIPILVLALTGGVQASSSPTSSDDAFASSEIAAA